MDAISPRREYLQRPVRKVHEAGWTFPFKGIYYFCRHPYLWPLLRGRLLPCFLLSFIVLFNLFLWTYLPQVAFLWIFQGHFAWVNGAFLVLSEGSVVVAMLFEAFLVNDTQVDVFDSVLVAKGHANLVATRRPVHRDQPDEDNPFTSLAERDSGATYSPFSFRQTIELVSFLPLYLIPIAGGPLYIFFNGRTMGPLQHYRYFKFLKLDSKHKDRYIAEWRSKYTWFGTVALALQFIPVLSMLFLITTPVGAALLAVYMVEQEQARLLDVEEQIIAPERHLEAGPASPYGTFA